MEIHWYSSLGICYWSVSACLNGILWDLLPMNMNDSWKRALERLFWFFFCMFCYFVILALTILIQK